MAEDEDGVADKKSPQNPNNGGPSQETEPNTSKPDLGIEEAKYNTANDSENSPTESKSSTSKNGSGTRKEENPFSFRHFLKRDLSLPGTSTYENTGARPKVYASTVQHSPTRVDSAEWRRDKARTVDTSREKNSDVSAQRIENVSSGSSVEITCSAVDNSDSKHNFYMEGNEVPFYQRPNLASEPLGMPSLPDFVQDHILVEQAYLNPNGPISVDLDNLPDFTFNTNFSAGSSSSLGRRNNVSYGGNRDNDYDSYMGAASGSSDVRPDRCEVPLDLPGRAEGAAAVPLDLPAHLSLDLTECVNPADRRNNSPRNSFPLDLPLNAGAESKRLPDFLPVHPGRTSPEPEHQDEQLQQIMSELERTRSELFMERSRRGRLEEELSSARQEAARARAALRDARHWERAHGPQLDAAADRGEVHLLDTASRATDAEATIAKLKSQIKNLKEELSQARGEARALRDRSGAAAADLRRATDVAELSLRDLLAGLEQLKSLSTSLEPT